MINFIGLPRLVVPTDPFTASLTIVGNSSGVMTNNTFSNETEILTFFDANSEIVLQLEGVFDNGTVDLSTLMIQMSSTAVAVNHSGVENVSRKWLYLNNTLDSGAYLCPNASVLSQISPTCPGVINWTVAEALANTTKEGVRCLLDGGKYIFSNVSGTGVSQVVASSAAIASSRGGGRGVSPVVLRNISSPVIERPAQLVRRDNPSEPAVVALGQESIPAVLSGAAMQVLPQKISMGWLLTALILLSVAIGLWASTLKISMPKVKLPTLNLPSMGIPRRKTSLERASIQLKEVDRLIQRHSRRTRRKDL
ncbi:hypothetical protein J4219_09000 [Candidatus Woesearchaeota archaeon]|nr:hypothetical protein [Candidatus Woesearchaeota archaeon]